MFNDMLRKTTVDQLCLHLHEKLIRMIFFDEFLFLSFKWNLRKIKKKSLQDERRKWHCLLWREKGNIMKI